MPWSDALPATTLGKFVGKDTLLKVLTTGSLRWSRPGTFNDPFDCQPRFKITPASDDLIESCLDELRRVLNGSASSLSITNPLGKLTGLMAEAISEGKLSQAEFEEEFKMAIRETLSGRDDLLRRHHDQVVLGLQDVKVLCLTKAFEETLMWSHYAANHSGALILFAPSSTDSQFSLAEPVIYTDEPIEFTDHSLLPKQLTGQTPLTSPERVREAMHKIVFTKANSWSYEAEWRILVGSGFKPEEEAEFNRFHLDDVVGVVFGAKYPKEDIFPFIGAASEFYPKARWFIAEPSTTDMRLRITEALRQS